MFNPEFLNRLDDVIVFHPLDRTHITRIVQIMLRDVRKRLSEEELTLTLTDAATDFLVGHGYDESYGARPLKRAIQRFIEDPLSEKILIGEFAKGEELEVDVSPDGTAGFPRALRLEGVTRSLVGAFVVGASLLAVPLAAQVSVFRPDSIAVVGLRRTDPRRAIADSRLVADTFVTYRDVQRAIESLLYATGAYQEVGYVPRQRRNEGRPLHPGSASGPRSPAGL